MARRIPIPRVMGEIPTVGVGVGWVGVGASVTGPFVSSGSGGPWGSPEGEVADEELEEGDGPDGTTSMLLPSPPLIFM
jgi:hypothetical protein